MPSRSAGFRSIALGLIALSAAVALLPLGYALDRWQAGETYAASFALVSALLLIAGAMIAFALVRHASERTDVRLLATFIVLWPLGAAIVVMRPVAPTMALLGANIAWLLGLAAAVRFSASFPRRLQVADVPATRGFGRTIQRASMRPGTVWVAAATTVILVTLMILFEPPGTSASGGRAAVVGLSALVGSFLAVAALIASVLNLRLGYLLSTEDERRRIFWVVEAFLIVLIVDLALGTVIGVLYGMSESLGIGDAARSAATIGMDVLSAAATLAALLCLAFAIFYRGDIDPRLVVKGTAVYGGLGLLLTVLFAGVETLVSDAIAARVGMPDGLGGWIASVAVAFAIPPAHRRLSRLVGSIVSDPGASAPPARAAPQTPRAADR